MIAWDKLLDGDLAVHIEDDLRSGAFGGNHESTSNPV